MTYVSIQFIFFLIIFMILFFIAPKVWMKQVIILIGNIVFYISAGGFSMLSLVVGTSFVTYFISRLIEKKYLTYDNKKAALSPKEQAALFATYKKRTIKYVILALFLIIGFLVFTKIGGLLGWTKVTSLTQVSSFSTYLVPLGLSYYTFSTVGYILDIYWRKTQPEHNYFKLLTCMTYFPHIVQGPISKYSDLMNQINHLKGFTYQGLRYGAQRILWGFFKKLVIADRIAKYTSLVYPNMNQICGAEVIFAIIMGVFELYCDFSGCMDIAIGTAEMMGIQLNENFQRPFFARSAAEFWRRWHITLGAWFKEYIYMPIAMNPNFIKTIGVIRKKLGVQTGLVFSTAIPLMIVWILTGLWHGTGTDYLVWGLYWGIIIITGTIFSSSVKKFQNKWNLNKDDPNLRLFQMVRTFFIFCGGRMLTITGSLAGVKIMLHQIVTDFQLGSLLKGCFFDHDITPKDSLILLMSIILVWLVDLLEEKGIKVRETLSGQSIIVRWTVLYTMVFLVLLFGIYGVGVSTGNFAYAHF